MYFVDLLNHKNELINIINQELSKIKNYFIHYAKQYQFLLDTGFSNPENQKSRS